jgi:hypothetical protein
MAHFAELNNSNEVLRVIVISNDDVDSHGGELSSEAETFVASIVPHGKMEQLGNKPHTTTILENNTQVLVYTYDASKDKFILPQPYPSWSLDSNDDWEAPVTYPTITEIDS